MTPTPSAARSPIAPPGRPAPWWLAGLCLLVGLLCSGTARAERRVALVIGNAAYAQGALKNPVNDARDMRDALQRLGFARGDIVYRENLVLRDIGPTLREFRGKLSADSVALVFYAGHGLQVRGENYLPAVDANIDGEEDVPQQSLKLATLMGVLAEAKTRLNLVFLDSCRNNPFKRGFRDGSRGLASSRDNTPSGTLIAYATRANDVAADGKGRNGTFTGALLEHMNSPGQPIEQVLKRVVRSVKSDTSGKQEPWHEGSLEGDFYFVPGAAVATPAPVVQPPAVPAPEPVRPTATAAGTLVKDCDVCPVLVVIPAGRFRMGSDDGFADEKPVRSVSVAAYLLGKTEVTQGQWQAVMGSNPSQFKECGAECPVDAVSWNEAQDYVKKLSQRSGKTYRLPSEAEWEYAERAGSATRWSFGDAEGQLGDHAWFSANSGDKTRPVAGKRPNAFGLYDMHGNVREWVQDCYDEKAYAGKAPSDGRAHEVAGCSSRVVRGGSWFHGPRGQRSASRDGLSPDVRGDSFLGFRLARMLP